MLGWNLYGFFGYDNFGRHISWSPAYPEFMAGSGHIGAARDPRELQALVWRNFATSFTRGFNSYWMHGFTVHDWFEEDQVQHMVRRHLDAIKESIRWSHRTMPGIAMVLDDSGVLETNGNFLNEAIMWEQKMGLARCGVPHRIYLFEDLELENFPPHRVFYFPNLFRVDEKRMEILQQKVFRAGKVVVWGPGSGISDGQQISPAAATRLTGFHFHFEMLPANAARRILLSRFDHPLTHNLRAATVIGGPLPYGPILLPTDGLELGLAWTKGGHNHIGMSLKEFGRGAPGNWAALFMAAVQLLASLWRNIARFAGAHVYCESNDIVLANSSMVALHSLKGGPKRLVLPAPSNVRDVVANTEYARNTSEIEFDLDPPETRVFLLEP